MADGPRLHRRGRGVEDALLQEPTCIAAGGHRYSVASYNRIGLRQGVLCFVRDGQNLHLRHVFDEPVLHIHIVGIDRFEENVVTKRILPNFRHTVANDDLAQSQAVTDGIGLDCLDRIWNDKGFQVQ